MATIEGKVLLEARHSLQKLLLVDLKSFIFVVKSVNFALQRVVFALQSSHLTSLAFQSDLHLLLHNLLNLGDVGSGIVQLLFILVSHLHA